MSKGNNCFLGAYLWSTLIQNKGWEPRLQNKGSSLLWRPGENAWLPLPGTAGPWWEQCTLGQRASPWRTLRLGGWGSYGAGYQHPDKPKTVKPWPDFPSATLGTLECVLPWTKASLNSLYPFEPSSGMQWSILSGRLGGLGCNPLTAASSQPFFLFVMPLHTLCLSILCPFALFYPTLISVGSHS